MVNVFETLEKYRKDKANVLVPSVLFDNSAGIYEPVLEVIQLSADEKDKDVYPGTSGKRLSSVALAKIAQCGGIEWNEAASTYTELSPGQYCTFKAVGGIRKADGRLIQYVGYYNIDMQIVREEIVSQATASAMKNANLKTDKARQDRINFVVDRDLRQKRKFMLQLAETGARNRVIRAMLSLKSEYSVQELAKPFVMMRYRLRIDYSDPEIRRIAQIAAIHQALGIYGPPASSQAPMLPAPEEPIDLPNSDDLTGADSGNPAADPEFPWEDPSDRDVFEGLDFDTQVKMLRDIITRKGYAEAELLRPGKAIEGFTDAHRLAFYDKVISMPAKEEAHA